MAVDELDWFRAKERWELVQRWEWKKTGCCINTAMGNSLRWWAWAIPRRASAVELQVVFQHGPSGGEAFGRIARGDQLEQLFRLAHRVADVAITGISAIDLEG